MTRSIIAAIDISKNKMFSIASTTPMIKMQIKPLLRLCSSCHYTLHQEHSPQNITQPTPDSRHLHRVLDSRSITPNCIMAMEPVPMTVGRACMKVFCL